MPLLIGNFIESVYVSPDRCSADICGETVTAIETAGGAETDQSGAQGLLSFRHSLDLEVVQFIVMAYAGFNGLEGAVDRAVTCSNSHQSSILVFQRHI